MNLYKDGRCEVDSKILVDVTMRGTMWTELHWVDGPWPGKLALAARPRGGDWLQEEIASWHGAGIDTVLSLLTPEEEQSLDLTNEASVVKARGMNFMQLPIPD